MAQYNSSNIKIEIDVSVGGALQDITANVTEISGIKVSGGTVDSTPFGVSFPEVLATGMSTYSDITLKFFYDDTATTGMNAVFSPRGVRSFKVTFGGSKSVACEVLITDYERIAKVGSVTSCSATLKPTGTVTEA